MTVSWRDITRVTLAQTNLWRAERDKSGLEAPSADTTTLHTAFYFRGVRAQNAVLLSVHVQDNEGNAGGGP